MNYQQTLEWMFQQLPMYQRIGKDAFKKDLSNIQKFSEHLGNPQKKFKSIHVAGTNGKGSTCHMLASILQEAGYKVGLYTSPHLKDFRERIKINGIEISRENVVEFIQKNKVFLESEKLSFFEMTVGMAFNLFSEERVDIAIIEVGLGGRLDSTNIILPEVAVITNIGLDHTQFLGVTLTEIAGEKAGIIKKDIPVVIGETKPETKAVFKHFSKEKSAPIFYAEVLNAPEYTSDLKGAYQLQNKKTVLKTLEILNSRGYKVPEDAKVDGFKKVVKNTGLRGRWELLNEAPKVICDTAHNAEGLQLVLNQLLKEEFEDLHFVLGVVNDKDLDGILSLFPKDASYYFSKPDVPRGLEAEVLKAKAEENGLTGMICNSIPEAYEKALKTAKLEDLIYVGGSTFTVAEII